MQVVRKSGRLKVRGLKIRGSVAAVYPTLRGTVMRSTILDGPDTPNGYRGRLYGQGYNATF